MSKIKVSVGVITYNQQKTIRQTLDSILMQKGDFDLEVVIGEDCSTDATHAICEEYALRFNELTTERVNELKRVEVKLLPNSHNLGIMSNFARVMQACTGDYVGICAGDDYWCDEYKLQKQLRYMRVNPQFGVCCTSGYRLMVKTGRLVQGIEPLHPVEDGNVSKFYKNHLSGIYAQPLSLLIRSDLLQYVDFEEFVRRKFPFEDYPMQSILAHHTLFGYIPDKTCVYRISTKSATFTSFDNENYMTYYSGIVNMRRYLHGLFPDDIPFSEEWAKEYLQHKQFLKYVWYRRYKQAEELAMQTNPASSIGRKIRWIVSNRLFFHIFCLYKRIIRYQDYKQRAN